MSEAGAGQEMAHHTPYKSNSEYSVRQDYKRQSWYVCTLQIDYPAHAESRLADIIISTPLRLVDSLTSGVLELNK